MKNKRPAARQAQATSSKRFPCFSNPSPYEIGRDIFDRHENVKPTEDIARHSKRLLRQPLRGKIHPRAV